MVALVVAMTLLVSAISWTLDRFTGDDGGGGGDPEGEVAERDPEADAGEAPFADPALVGQPWTTASVEGILTFRGNPTRTYFGSGPVPRDPEVAFRFPTEPMCSESSDLGETKTWCGMGWTGQPAVFERDGRTWAVFGAYDRNVHFIDADSGERILPDFPTGDLIKGSVTIDPDGFPLVYTGSRDNFLRILSIEGDTATELWKLSSEEVRPVRWNDDWDASPLVINDYLIEGGENGQLHIVRLNRALDEEGHVTVDPELVFNAPGWDDELLAALPDQTVSIESSPVMVGDTVYFSNSGGLIQGWDLSGLGTGEAPVRTFRYWAGDDTDATISTDADGMLYVAVEYERYLDRASEVGQLLKLDPNAEGDPLVWKVDDRDVRPGGLWGSPAVTEDSVYASTNAGEVFAVDRASGEKRWSIRLPGPTWGSPVVVDDVLLIGDCGGTFHAYDVSDPRVKPPEIWSLELGGCIEATPAVWKDRILIGTRAGFLHMITSAS